MRRFNGQGRVKGYLVGCGVAIAVPAAIVGLFLLDSMDIPYRTYTIEAGSYTGRVTDRDTGLPIEGAAVYLDCSTWRDNNAMENFGGIEAGNRNYYIGESLTFTDARGYYRAPDATFRMKISLRARKPLVEMLVFKKGYVGYNSGFDFDGENKNLKESTLRPGDNPIALQPWPKNYSSFKHLFFMDVMQYTRGAKQYHTFREIVSKDSPPF